MVSPKLVGGMPKVEVVSEQAGFMSVILSKTDVYTVNELRRILMLESTGLAISSVEIEVNTSVLFDEVLAHRVSLIPILSHPEVFPLPQECDCVDHCDKCSSEIYLNVSGCSVNSNHFEYCDPRFQIMPDVELVRLQPAQKIQLRALITRGTRKDSSKYGDVVSAGYTPIPIVNFHKKKLSVREKQELIACCPSEVFSDIEELRIDASRCTSCGACENQLPSVITISSRRESFLFHLETHGDKTKEIFEWGLEHLRTRVPSP